MLRDSFGVVSGQGEFQVIIRFDSYAADYIREKRWHPSQQLRELKDGRVELRLKLSSLQEVRRWVLSWEGEATVVQPAARSMPAAEMARILVYLIASSMESLRLVKLPRC